MGLACLSALATKMALCITPFVVHMQLLLKKSALKNSAELISLNHKKQTSNPAGPHLKVMTKAKANYFEHAFQLSPSVTSTSPLPGRSHPHSLVSWP